MKVTGTLLFPIGMAEAMTWGGPWPPPSRLVQVTEPGKSPTWHLHPDRRLVSDAAEIEVYTLIKATISGGAGDWAGRPVALYDYLPPIFYPRKSPLTFPDM